MSHVLFGLPDEAAWSLLPLAPHCGCFSYSPVFLGWLLYSFSYLGGMDQATSSASFRALCNTLAILRTWTQAYEAHMHSRRQAMSSALTPKKQPTQTAPLVPPHLGTDDDEGLLISLECEWRRLYRRRLAAGRRGVTNADSGGLTERFIPGLFLEEERKDIRVETSGSNADEAAVQTHVVQNVPGVQSAVSGSEQPQPVIHAPTENHSDAATTTAASPTSSSSLYEQSTEITRFAWWQRISSDVALRRFVERCGETRGWDRDQMASWFFPAAATSQVVGASSARCGGGDPVAASGPSQLDAKPPPLLALLKDKEPSRQQKPVTGVLTSTSPTILDAELDVEMDLSDPDDDDDETSLHVATTTGLEPPVDSPAALSGRLVAHVRKRPRGTPFPLEFDAALLHFFFTRDDTPQPLPLPSAAETGKEAAAPPNDIMASAARIRTVGAS